MIARVFQFFPRKIIFLHLSRKKKKKKKKEEAKKYLVGIQTSSNQYLHLLLHSSILFLPLFLSLYMHIYVL